MTNCTQGFYCCSSWFLTLSPRISPPYCRATTYTLRKRLLHLFLFLSAAGFRRRLILKELQLVGSASSSPTSSSESLDDTEISLSPLVTLGGLINIFPRSGQRSATGCSDSDEPLFCRPPTDSIYRSSPPDCVCTTGTADQT